MSTTNKGSKRTTRTSKNNPSNGSDTEAKAAPTQQTTSSSSSATVADTTTGSLVVPNSKRLKVASSADTPAENIQTTPAPASSEAMVVDPPISNSLVADVIKQVEKENMQAAAREALSKQNNASKHASNTSQTTPTAQQSIEDSIHAQPSTKGKGKAIPPPEQQLATGSSPNKVIKPITTKPAQPRTIINRSTRHHICIPTSAFGNKTDANIKSIVHQLFVHLATLANVSIYTRKSPDPIKYVQVSFSSKRDAIAAIEHEIPGVTGDVTKFIALFEQEMQDDSRPQAKTATQEKEDRNNRTIRVTEIPLTFDEDCVHTLFKEYGHIENFKLETRKLWQTAVITFETPDVAELFRTQWCVIHLRHCLRVWPFNLTDTEYQQRSKYVAKLTGLPRGTTVLDLLDIISAVEAKSCIIPKYNRSYQNKSFAYMAFSTEEALNDAYTTAFALTDANLEWCSEKAATCNICGALEHKASACPKNKKKSNRKYETIYNKYKPKGYDKLIPSRRPRDSKVTQGKSFAQATRGQSSNSSSSSGSYVDALSSPPNSDNGSASPNKYSNEFEQIVLQKLSSIEARFDVIENNLSDLSDRIADLETEVFGSYHDQMETVEKPS